MCVCVCVCVCVCIMIERFKEAVDNGNGFGAVLTDLSKAFDCIYYS